ncbi:MAG TPA: hypothetical protein VGE51_12405 [Fontimonas sp.]
MFVRRGLLAFGAMVATWLGTVSVAQAAGAIVCWDEADGRRACGDRVPPEFVKQERQVYDNKGQVVRTLPRQKTPDEVAEEARRAAELAAKRKKLEEAANHDRFLQSTYSSVKDLERTRNDNLATLDGRLRLAEKSLVDNQTGIAQLEQQVADFTAKNPNKKVPFKLSRQLDEFKATLGNNTRAVEALKLERKAAVEKFDYDIRRFRELSENSMDPDGGKATPATTGTAQPAATATP